MEKFVDDEIEDDETFELTKDLESMKSIHLLNQLKSEINKEITKERKIKEQTWSDVIENDPKERFVDVFTLASFDKS